MAIGRHIGDRSHIKEKERNMYSGEVEDNEEYVNLDEGMKCCIQVGITLGQFTRQKYISCST